MCSTILAVLNSICIHTCLLYVLFCFIFRHAYKYTCISFIDAGNLDFTPIRSSNLNVFETLNQNNTRACFDVTITPDQAFENTETFSLLLSFNDLVPDSVRSIVTIDPSMVYVTIEDITGMQNVSKIRLIIACRYLCT